MIDFTLATFLLVFFRLTSFFLIAPVFSMRGVPATYKLGLGFFVSLLVVHVVGINSQVMFNGEYLLLIIKEVLVGLVLGLSASIFIYALQMAGGLIDIMMGFSIVNVIDPQTGSQAPVMGNFKYIIAILFLFFTDGHHLLIRGILNSFFLIPVNKWAPMLEGTISQALIELFIRSFAISIQIAAPLVAALFLVDVALGLISRTVPQMNVFVVGIPVKILAGYMVLLLVLPGFGIILNLLFKELFRSMELLTEIMVK